MNYFRKIYEWLITAIKGMLITFDHLGQQKVTNQYPEIYHPIKSGDMPLIARNRLFVDMDGCDGCDSCAKACPVACITVESVRVTPGDENVPDMNNGKPRKTWVTKHEIDFAKCCFCSLCTFVCPTDAITMTQEFEYSEFDRDKLIYNFTNLSPEQVIEKQKMFEEHQIAKKKEQEEKKKAEAEAKKLAEIEAAKKAEESKPSEGETTPKADSNAQISETTAMKEETKVLSPEEEAKQKEREARRAENERKRAERLAAAKSNENT